MIQNFRDLIDKNPAESITKLVYKYIYNEIISLSMPPGAKINHTKLANDLEVSRTTVRDAVLLLMNSNLVEPLPNQGFRVSPLKIKEMSEIYATRKIIETGAAKILCEKITNEQTEHFNNLLHRMKEVTEQQDYESFAILDSEFHKCIIKFCSNQYIISMYKSIEDIIFRYIAYTAYPQNISPHTPLMLRQHFMIFTSIQLGMTENAVNVLEKHFTDAEKSLMFPYYHLST